MPNDLPKMSSPLNQGRYILMMILAILIIELSSDLHFPNLPEMAQYFGTQEHVVVMTISFYLLGFSILGFLSGPFSDTFGRRPVFLVGTALFAVSSYLCWDAQTVYQLIHARFCQGLSAGIIYVVSNAIIKDVFDDKVCSQIFSSIGMIVALSPAVAPILGAKIALYYGWQTNFKVILGAAIIGFVVPYLFLKESLPKGQRQVLSIRALPHRYLLLLKRPEVTGYALISGLMCGALWSWIAIAPFYFIEVIGVSAQQYGYYAAIGPASYIIGTFINQLCVCRVGVDRMLQWGMILSVLGVLLLIYAAFFYEALNVLLFIGLIVFCIGLAPVFSNSATMCVNVESYHRGAASAILTLFETSFAGAFAYVSSIMNNQTLQPAALLITFSIIASFLIYWWIKRKPQFYFISE